MAQILGYVLYPILVGGAEVVHAPGHRHIADGGEGAGNLEIVVHDTAVAFCFGCCEIQHSHGVAGLCCCQIGRIQLVADAELSLVTLDVTDDVLCRRGRIGLDSEVVDIGRLGKRNTKAFGVL